MRPGNDGMPRFLYGAGNEEGAAEGESAYTAGYAAVPE